MTSTGQKVLESRRRHEDKTRAMQASLADERKVMAMATFETSTAKRIDQRTKQERFEQLQRSSEMNLLRRRQNLADLYNYEREQWQNEVLSRVESVEDRKQRYRFLLSIILRLRKFIPPSLNKIYIQNYGACLCFT
jgi:hypothetical protein